MIVVVGEVDLVRYRVVYPYKYRLNISVSANFNEI